jgi:hypothetical protein
MAAVTYQGVGIFAPASWGRNQLSCGTPIRDTVVVNPGPSPLCLLLPVPRVSYVWLRSCSGDCGADPEAAVARQVLRVSGQSARRGEDQLSDGRDRVVLVLTGRRVVVVAVSPDPSVARTIIDSAYLSPP